MPVRTCSATLGGMVEERIRGGLGGGGYGGVRVGEEVRVGGVGWVGGAESPQQAKGPRAPHPTRLDSMANKEIK